MDGTFRVIFLNERGVQITKRFSSPFLARRFANRIKYGKRCTLIMVEGVTE